MRSVTKRDKCAPKYVDVYRNQLASCLRLRWPPVSNTSVSRRVVRRVEHGAYVGAAEAVLGAARAAVMVQVQLRTTSDCVRCDAVRAGDAGRCGRPKTRTDGRAHGAALRGGGAPDRPCHAWSRRRVAPRRGPGTELPATAAVAEPAATKHAGESTHTQAPAAGALRSSSLPRARTHTLRRPSARDHRMLPIIRSV